LGVYAGVDLFVDGVDVTEGDGAKLAIKVSTEGIWEDTLYFLALSESFPANINIDSAKITKLENLEKGYERWTGEFTITVLSFIDAQGE
ncbi:hypothetical protein ACFL22_01020, partial [Patescibacteria group bacterium]